MTKHEVEAYICTSTELVCTLGEQELEETTTVTIKKDLPFDQGDKAKAFTEDVNKLLEKIQGVDVKVAAKIRAGDKY